MADFKHLPKGKPHGEPNSQIGSALPTYRIMNTLGKRIAGLTFKKSFKSLFFSCFISLLDQFLAEIRKWDVIFFIKKRHDKIVIFFFHPALPRGAPGLKARSFPARAPRKVKTGCFPKSWPFIPLFVNPDGERGKLKSTNSGFAANV